MMIPNLPAAWIRFFTNTDTPDPSEEERARAIATTETNAANRQDDGVPFPPRQWRDDATARRAQRAMGLPEG